ncbi:pentatricopeptide repeat-containing protein At2g27800, mitochondrial-like [Wolffia australiana]
MLSKALHLFDRMPRPTLSTYNLLLSALLAPPKSSSFTHHLHMDAVRRLFRRMLDAGVEPDVVSLNSVIRGYVLALHVNDALRVFHQMGVAYRCLPDGTTYGLLVHGLCAQGRTVNAKELFLEMKSKGFVPCGKVFNSLASALAMAGELDGAVEVLWEMEFSRRRGDFITFRTVLEEMCRRGREREAVGLLKEFREKRLVCERAFRELLSGLEDDFF